MSVGKRIKALRQNSNISQVELADAIHVTKQNLYKYENEIITNIPLDKIEAISNYFNVSPAYLMGWTDNGEKIDVSTGNLSMLKFINVCHEALSYSYSSSSPVTFFAFFNLLIFSEEAVTTSGSVFILLLAAL